MKEGWQAEAPHCLPAAGSRPARCRRQAALPPCCALACQPPRHAPRLHAYLADRPVPLSLAGAPQLVQQQEILCLIGAAAAAAAARAAPAAAAAAAATVAAAADAGADAVFIWDDDLGLVGAYVGGEEPAGHLLRTRMRRHRSPRRGEAKEAGLCW